MLGFVPEWRITHANTLGVTPGPIAEALQREAEEMEEGLEGLRGE